MFGKLSNKKNGKIRTKNFGVMKTETVVLPKPILKSKTIVDLFPRKRF